MDCIYTSWATPSLLSLKETLSTSLQWDAGFGSLVLDDLDDERARILDLAPPGADLLLVEHGSPQDDLTHLLKNGEVLKSAIRART